MLGLGFIVFFILYFYIAWKIVARTIKWLRRFTSIAPLLGGITFLFLLSPIFWDLIPTYKMHKQECEESGGFEIYKNFSQWKMENPKVAETFMPTNGKRIVKGNTFSYQMNQRFIWNTTKTQIWHILYKSEETIVDLKTKEVLASYIDFYTDVLNPLRQSRGQLSDFKLWMKIDTCEKSRLHKKKFREFKSTLTKNKEIRL